MRHRGAVVSWSSVALLYRHHHNTQLHSNHWLVEGAPMAIPFEHVFLRPKQGVRETDLVFDETDFATLARRCWGEKR